ncbi:hypothetical protein BS47DRAFT_1456802 [Hydnum rufescens UP504]|uniref:Uncharacterized protein n=1 Tax=Hydnum rufescens UP504 TaxID=1448309 RepID=A0A9P6AXJ0_9AGAM|nr:hypothetical protein BS47DRAFT_1456802 [Hydnum rufescens UP504]
MPYIDSFLPLLNSISTAIANLDFVALKRAGYRGAIFDKDNCLTIPNEDRLVPQLQRAWDECLRTFDAGHVVIVSNSAGTREDVSGLEAESVSYHLQVPVLFHDIHKPGCRDVILRYYATLTTPSHCSSPSTYPSHNAPESQVIPRLPIKPSELIVVGDRLFTDVLMGNQLGALTIWTQGLWKRELMPMRFFEKSILWALDKPKDEGAGRRARYQCCPVPSDIICEG